jgi:hypothetical protein
LQSDYRAIAKNSEAIAMRLQNILRVIAEQLQREMNAFKAIDDNRRAIAERFPSDGNGNLVQNDCKTIANRVQGECNLIAGQ